jgi:hypothetical protein
MIEFMQQLITKAQIVGITLDVAKAGLCLGDTAYLRLQDDGHVALFAQGRQRWFGFYTRRPWLQLGLLGPIATDLLSEHLRRNLRLRVRIVGLTPAHLSKSHHPEVSVSVWGAVERGINGYHQATVQPA